MEREKGAAELAEAAVERGEPTAWFEELYRRAETEAQVPWADGRPNPHLVEWLDAGEVEGAGRRALVVGCGLGDDVEALAARGFEATGFDVSPTAIEWCRERFPESGATYLVADLFDPPAAFRRAFDLVVEVYTLQSLPRPERRRALAAVASFVAPGGTLLVVARGRDADEAADGPPWPLTRAEVLAATDEGLALREFDDYEDEQTPPVRRFRATFERPPP